MSAQIPITLKLYASLATYLPDGHKRNEASVHVLDGTTVEQLLDAHKMPRKACHLVLVNGVYQSPKARTSLHLKSGDAVAVWPPVAGG